MHNLKHEPHITRCPGQRLQPSLHVGWVAPVTDEHCATFRVYVLAESQLVVALPKVPRPSLAVLDNLGVELQPQYGVGASMLASATAIASLPSNHVSGSRIPL